MARKWKDSRGLTLVETLCAVAILVLLGLLINTGLNLALRSYRDIIAQSELELLLSTLSDTLADDLRYAQRVEVNGDRTLKEYHSERYNTGDAVTTLKVGEEDGRLYANEYPMLPSGAYGSGGAYVIGTNDGASGLKITYNEGLFTVNLTVKQAEGELSAKASFSVRCLNPDRTT